MRDQNPIPSDPLPDDILLRLAALRWAERKCPHDPVELATAAAARAMSLEAAGSDED